MKPTYGRVSRYGLVAFASSLDQIGPMARSVKEAAIMLGVISGRDRFDATAVELTVPDFAATLDSGVSALVVGVPREYFTGDLDTRVAELCGAAVMRLESVGAEIRAVSLPHTSYDGVRYGWRAEGADSSAAVYDMTRGAGFGSEVKRRIMLGTYGLSAGYYDEYYGRAQRVRRLIADDFARAFAEVDVVFTPTTPTTAFELGERVDDPVQMYLSDVFTVTANLAGLPAISIPIGALDGLPVGGQFISRHFDEETMLRVAYALAQLSTEDD